MIYKCQLLKFIFKLVHKQLPQYFTQIQFIFNNQQHHHNTRTCQKVNVQRVNYKFAKRNIIQYSAALTYNITPSNIIEKPYSHSFERFSLYIKRLTIQSYNGMCSVYRSQLLFMSQKQYYNRLNIDLLINAFITHMYGIF